MDYKTNFLSKEVQATTEILPEIDGLKFGIIGEDKMVFDYTEYLTANNLNMVDYKIFMKWNKPHIETLLEAAGQKTNEAFYQNTNGHILVAAELVYLFLSFVNPEMCIYFNSLIHDAISSGVALSDGYIYSLAADRMQIGALKTLIKEKMTDEKPEQ